MSEASKQGDFSKRAQILARVVDWVNQDRYKDYGSWMLFGKMGAETGGELQVLDEKSDPGEETFHEMTGDLQVQVGKVLDAKRFSLEADSPRPQIRGAEVYLPDWEPKPGWRDWPEPDRSEVAEYLDAKYSLEVIEKLEKIVQKATLLDPHEVDVKQIRDPSVRAYFQEAQRCYLYGFNRACAVMCRALLDAALKEKFDPDGKIESKLPSKHSLFKALLEGSGLQQPLPDRAQRVKLCGDWAAHNDPRFRRECESQGGVEDNLGWTRAILAALYPRASNLGI